MSKPSQPAPQADIHHAARLHQGGQLEEAEKIYRAILKSDPKNFDACHLLGVIFMQRGDAAAAEKQISRALALKPEDPTAHDNLANVLGKLCRPEEALRHYDRALALKPAQPVALFKRALVLMQLHRPEEALASCDKAIALKQDYADAHILRGNMLAELQRPGEALACFATACALNPGYAGAWLNHGNTLSDLRRYEDALASYDRVIALQPDNAMAYYNRGITLKILGRAEQALESYNRAIALQPAHAGAYNNRGIVLGSLLRHEEALADYDRAIGLRPGFAEAIYNRGNALNDLKRPEEAFARYNRAIELRPDYAEAFVTRGNSLQSLLRKEEALADYDRAIALQPDFADAYVNRGNVLKDLKRFDEAAASFGRALALKPDYAFIEGIRQHAMMFQCNWHGYTASTVRLRERIQKGERATAPFAFLALPSTAEEQLKCAQAYVASQFPPLPPLWHGERYKHDKIRVAYISADFYGHATAWLMAGLFEQHDRSKFEVTALSFSPDGGSDMQKRLLAAFDRFIDVGGMSDQQVSQLMREMEIDIAVDLKGFTQDARVNIFARRAAPVQVNYIGYPCTMGAPYIDYIIADNTVIPPELEPAFSEKVVRMPHTYQVNDSKRVISARTYSRAELGLPENAFVFCSFNANFKITPDIFDIWMRLLKGVDGSVLWLFEGSSGAAENLRREAKNRGVSPERLVFAPRMPLEDHLARHRQADLFLDTLPCNAHTTASDALWAGLPVVTCLGQTFASRVAGSLLNAAGLPELVTQSLEEYERLALQLAREPQKLAALKAKLAQNRDTCPLFDTARYTRNLEAAYTKMWERYQAGLAPGSFGVV